jgi:16S rRNA (guanine527-N7)-methyltransferase
MLIDLDVSRGVIEEFVSLLVKWNKVINLVSIKNTQDLWLRHIEDSMQLVHFIESEDKNIIDLGSGAGFPGLILSFCGVKNVTLIESDSRKSAFLSNAAMLSCNKVTVINDRVENTHELSCDIVTSRGLCDINTLLTLTRGINMREKCLFLKGKTYRQELEYARKNWTFEECIYHSSTSSEGKVIELKNIRPNI